MKNAYIETPAWVEPILIPDERVVWEGKPAPISFLAEGFWFWGRGIVVILSLCVIWFVAGYFWDVHVNFEKLNSKGLAIGMLVLLILPAIYRVAKRAAQLKNMEYCITNKRIISYTGVYNKVYDVVEFDQLSDINILRSNVGSRFNSGTIIFNTEVIEYDHNDDANKLCCVFVSVAKPFEIIKYAPNCKLSVNRAL